MGEQRAKELHDQLNKLRSERYNFDTTWERIARVVLPTSVGFITRYWPGTNLNTEIFDSTAQLALPRFAAAIDTLITPQTSTWHNLAPRDKTLAYRDDVRRFCDDLNALLFRARYAPRANFASRVFEAYMSLGAFGNGVLYIHDARPGIRYISVHLSEVWFDEDSNGQIDSAYWVHEYTARQAMQKWPDKLPQKIRDMVDKAPLSKLKFCKAVYPRTERDPSRRDAKNMPYADCTFLLDDESVIVEESGYRTFPFAVARYVTAPREKYARGPAHDALSNILMLQEMMKTTLRSGQLAVDPPSMAADADSLDPFAMRAGAVNYGYLGPNGEEMIKPYITGAKPDFSLQMMNEARQSINAAFLINLFQVLVEQQGDRKTATEVLALQQEKGALLGPIGGRLRSEFLGRIIEREIDILFHAGAVNMDAIPDGLREDGELDIEYDSPLTRAMKAEEGIGILRTLETAGQLAQYDPSVLKEVNVRRAFRRIADVNGAPADILYSPDEMAARDAADQQQVQAQQMLQAAPVIADTVKTLTEAQATAGKASGVI